MISIRGEAFISKSQLHVDRCLTGRSCETTCPSGAQYGRLMDVGRNIVEKQVGGTPIERLKRATLRAVLSRSAVFNPLLKLGQLTRPLLPASVRRKIPKRLAARSWPTSRHARRMLVLQGCAQRGIAPTSNPALTRVLDRIGISLVHAPTVGRCGAVSYHLNAWQEGLDDMRRDIQAWWACVEQGGEAIVTTASGCGAMVKEYGRLQQCDERYRKKARRISALTKGATEILASERQTIASSLSPPTSHPTAVAFHSPCALQHGQQIRGLAESLLSAADYSLTPVPEVHLCCGSAGTYSILQADLSRRLLLNKFAGLSSGSPAVIAAANVGCLAHIQSATALPVRHWVGLFDAALA